MNFDKARAAKYIISFFAVFMAIFVMAHPAFAQTSGNQLMAKIVDGTALWPQFLYMGAYIIGVWFAISGLIGLRNANENPGRVPLRNAFGRLVIGGMFLAIGTMIMYIIGTVEVTDAVITGGNNGGDSVAANTLGGMMKSSMSNIGLLPAFVSAVCYFGAVYFAITGFLMLQAFIEDSSRNPISKVLMRLLGSGFLLAFPSTLGIIINTFGGDSSKTGVCFNGGSTGSANCNAWSVSAVDGNGFDAVLANIVNNIGPPLMQYALPAFCYFVGIVFIAVCLYRLAIASSDASRAPGSMGTFVTLFVGAAFLSFAHMIAYTRGSIFDTGTVYNQMQFVSTNPMDPEMQARAIAAFTAVLVFLRIVGYISFARGLFILRAFGEGRSGGSIMGAVTHIAAGGMLANLGALLNAVQNTTDIHVFTFT